MSDPRMLSDAELARIRASHIGLDDAGLLIHHIIAQQEAIRELWTALDDAYGYVPDPDYAAVLAKYKPEGL